MVSIDITEIHNEARDLRPSITARVALSFVDMAATTRTLLAEKPSEARLLLLVLISDMFFILSWSLKALVSPTASASALMGTSVIMFLIVAMMLRTTAVYALALAIAWGVRMAGGSATVQETRTGVFWGVFVAAPLGLLVSELAVLINKFEGTVGFLANEQVQMMPYWLGLVPFVWFVAKGAATANNKDSGIPLFGILSAGIVLLAIAARFISAA